MMGFWQGIIAVMLIQSGFNVLGIYDGLSLWQQISGMLLVWFGLLVAFDWE